MLLPAPLSWRSKVMIAAFSAFVVWRSAVPYIEEAAKKEKVPHNRIVDRYVRRLDIGITLFAIVVNWMGLWGLPYRFLAPLFFADPLAALIGNVTRQAEKAGVKANLPMQAKKKSVCEKRLILVFILFAVAWDVDSFCDLVPDYVL
eukprot:Protomagalhaensia_wolfi_Nauph_80__2340@NODE_2536_length_1061_cov_27_409980_g1986_i0_p1_GENE_NODE_2536_length_1061_cov_27_409980_g1986_i0NODE_2536_length_1061_cov_27_409980_g1986_i0_p1_ORF_typecomplete_len146_score25_58Fuseless/PF15993_5/0_0077_NODE_2536_length_1061_cov_27_409980_g1986_i0297734